MYIRFSVYVFFFFYLLIDNVIPAKIARPGLAAALSTALYTGKSFLHNNITIYRIHNISCYRGNDNIFGAIPSLHYTSRYLLLRAFVSFSKYVLDFAPSGKTADEIIVKTPRVLFKFMRSTAAELRRRTCTGACACACGKRTVLRNDFLLLIDCAKKKKRKIPTSRSHFFRNTSHMTLDPAAADSFPKTRIIGLPI